MTMEAGLVAEAREAAFEVGQDGLDRRSENRIVAPALCRRVLLAQGRLEGAIRVSQVDRGDAPVGGGHEQPAEGRVGHGVDEAHVLRSPVLAVNLTSGRAAPAWRGR